MFWTREVFGILTSKPQGPSQRDWFSSIEFRSWLVGSIIAVAGMPTLTVLMRNNADKMEAWTFFAGGVGSLLVTLWFLVVLYKFPRFLRRVRVEGADAEVVVRLTTFDELNVSLFFTFSDENVAHTAPSSEFVWASVSCSQDLY